MNKPKIRLCIVCTKWNEQNTMLCENVLTFMRHYEKKAIPVLLTLIPDDEKKSNAHLWSHSNVLKCFVLTFPPPTHLLKTMICWQRINVSKNKGRKKVKNTKIKREISNINIHFLGQKCLRIIILLYCFVSLLKFNCCEGWRHFRIVSFFWMWIWHFILHCARINLNIFI